MKIITDDKEYEAEWKEMDYTHLNDIEEGVYIFNMNDGKFILGTKEFDPFIGIRWYEFNTNNKRTYINPINIHAYFPISFILPYSVATHVGKVPKEWLVINNDE